MDLKILKESEYEGEFPTFRRPLEIGRFSLDYERTFCDDMRQIRFLHKPPTMTKLHMDLNEGYSEAIKKEFGKTEKIDNLLKWIRLHQTSVRRQFYVENIDKTKIDFVCFRGLLTTIWTTPYENKEDWIICATKHNSVIYLCAFDTAQDLERYEKMTDREKLMCSWGYKFEQYMTSVSKYCKPSITDPVCEKEEYCITLKGRLQHHTLLYSAEVDGEDPSYVVSPGTYPFTTARYIELKTTRVLTSERQKWNFWRFKLLKWWAQSFLVGIQKIYCGFRDDNGIVKDIRVYSIDNIRAMAQDLWSPSVCANFCSYFLDHVKKCVVKDDPKVVYKFYRKPGQDIICCEELTSPTDYQILPEWYIFDVNI